MLVHQSWETEVVASASVKLKDRTVANTSLTGPVHSGIRTGSDGVLSLIQANGGFSAVSGEWLLSGLSSAFWIQRTILVGTLEVDPGAGFLQMNTNRTYDNQIAVVGTKGTIVFFEISSSVGGTPVIETATMTFNSTLDVDF